jgi:PAS domain S-box-containing protein
MSPKVGHDGRPAEDAAASLRSASLLARDLLAANEQLVIRSLLDQESAESAEEGRAQLNALVDALSEGIALIDASGRFLMMNRAASAILGVAEWSLLSNADADALDLRDLNSVSLPLQHRPFARALRGEHFVDVESLLVRADGQSRNLLTSGTSIMDRGKVSLAIVVLRDVTELRTIERQRDEYLALVSHDIRGPLSAIFSLAESLKGIADTDGLPDKVVDRALRIERNAMKISAMVTDLLETTSVASTRGAARHTPLDLVALVRGSVELLADAVRQRVRFGDVLESPCVIIGDAVQIDRAFGNLMSNALKYSTDDVQVCLERRGAYAAIVVVDQGVGIPRADLPRVFDRYYRAPSEAHVSGSFGLGLYITRLIAEAHLGRAEVQSTRGKGSTFSLLLPLRDPDAAELA